MMTITDHRPAQGNIGDGDDQQEHDAKEDAQVLAGGDVQVRIERLPFLSLQQLCFSLGITGRRARSSPSDPLDFLLKVRAVRHHDHPLAAERGDDGHRKPTAQTGHQ